MADEDRLLLCVRMSFDKQPFGIRSPNMRIDSSRTMKRPPKQQLGVCSACRGGRSTKSYSADVVECHRLEAFAGYPSGEALLARYNVAQVQVALFRAVEMIVWASDDFKTILRYAKLARLMHSIRLLSDGRYERFDWMVRLRHCVARAVMVYRSQNSCRL